MALSEIGIELTNQCGFRCIHCARDFRFRPQADFDIELLRCLVPQCRELGIRHFAFTGGEPTLHPRLFDALDLIVSAGCDFHIVTNAYDYLKIAQLITRTPREALTGISLSIDGGTADTHDKIRGRKSFENLLKTISICIVRGVPVSAQMVVMRQNVDEIEALEELLSSLGVSRLHYCHIHPVPGVEGEMLTVDERLAVEDRVRKVAERSKIHVQLSAGHYVESPLASCRFLGLDAIYVDVYGRLCFCCQLSGIACNACDESEIIADLREMPLAEAIGILAEAQAKFTAEKARAASAGSLTEEDHFPCIYCAGRFGKLRRKEKGTGLFAERK